MNSAMTNSGSHKIVEGNLIATGIEVVVVASRFNGFIVEKLVEGALDALVRHGADPARQTVIWVPGAWEIPLAVQAAIQRKKPQPASFGVVAVGAVIRGSTGHYEHVAGEVQKGIAQMSWQTGVPVGNGVLTVESLEQAIERAGTKMGNKGAEAALAVVEMVNVLKGLG